MRSQIYIYAVAILIAIIQSYHVDGKTQGSLFKPHHSHSHPHPPHSSSPVVPPPHLPSVSNCTLGFDNIGVAFPASTSFFQCMVTAGYGQVSLFVQRNSDCTLDTSINETAQLAQSAGLTVDINIEPAPLHCQFDPGHQIEYILNLFDNAHVRISRLWFNVVVSASSGWTPNHCDMNGAFLGPAMRHAAHRLRPGQIGVYSQSQDWTTLMCDAKDFMHAALWYIHKDGKESYGDFQSFGGWTNPLSKQFNQQTICNQKVNVDYRNNGGC